MKSQSINHLYGLKLKYKYGFDIDPKDIQSLDWNRLKDDVAIGLYSEKYNRTISWSDNGEQPDDELLLEISFPTGAYMFGDDYPKEFFKQFFLELKSYIPKYLDTRNSTLYFAMNNASKVYNNYDKIIEKYYEINKIDRKQREIKRIERELIKLKGCAE